jgi:Ca-activated chloride channel homolog
MLRYSIALILFAAGTLSPAQTLEIPDFKVTVDVELVQLPVSVVDKQGLPYRGLEQGHFAVYEDKVMQEISLFKQEDIPLSVGLVIDASDSMLDKRDRLNTAAMTFVRESNPEDETSIVSFGTEVFLEQEFTRDTGELNRSLARVNSGGDTALYDAVLLAANYLQRNGSHEKKVLLVVTDGEDNKSKYTLKEVLKTVAESKVMVYTVGLLNSGFYAYGPARDTAKEALKQLAEVTGGVSFFPKDVNDVQKVCIRIARDLRSQYTIGYRPLNQNLDGSWRKVQVRLNPPKNAPSLKVRTKQGYYAPRKREPLQSMK